MLKLSSVVDTKYKKKFQVANEMQIIKDDLKTNRRILDWTIMVSTPGTTIFRLYML